MSYGLAFSADLSIKAKRTFFAKPDQHRIPSDGRGEHTDELAQRALGVEGTERFFRYARMSEWM